MMLEIKNFYPNASLVLYKYIQMKLNSFLEDVIKEYGLNKKSKKGWVVICRNNKSYVYIAASRNPGKFVFRRVIIKTRMRTK